MGSPIFVTVVIGEPSERPGLFLPLKLNEDAFVLHVTTRLLSAGVKCVRPLQPHFACLTTGMLAAPGSEHSNDCPEEGQWDGGRLVMCSRGGR